MHKITATSFSEIAELSASSECESYSQASYNVFCALNQRANTLMFLGEHAIVGIEQIVCHDTDGCDEYELREACENLRAIVIFLKSTKLETAVKYARAVAKAEKFLKEYE